MQVIGLDEVPRLISDGAVVGIGGMTLYRRPAAMARALAASRVRNLTLVGWTLGYEAELLVEAGCVACVRTSYAGLEVFGNAPALRREIEAGRVARPAECESSITLGILAAALRVPGLPVGGGLCDTDFPSLRTEMSVSEDGAVWMPAIGIDVALLHAETIDIYGNAYSRGQSGIDRVLAAVANKTIVSAERIADPPPGKLAAIPGCSVDYVVEASGGAWPTSCWPRYTTDFEFLLDRVREEPDRWPSQADLERVRLQ